MAKKRALKFEAGQWSGVKKAGYALKSKKPPFPVLMRDCWRSIIMSSMRRLESGAPVCPSAAGNPDTCLKCEYMYDCGATAIDILPAPILRDRTLDIDNKGILERLIFSMSENKKKTLGDIEKLEIFQYPCLFQLSKSGV